MLVRPSTVSTSAATEDGTLASDDGARYVLPLTEYECSDVLYAASVCAAVPETWTAWLLAETTCSPAERSHDSTAVTCAAVGAVAGLELARAQKVVVEGVPGSGDRGSAYAAIPAWSWPAR